MTASRQQDARRLSSPPFSGVKKTGNQAVVPAAQMFPRVPRFLFSLSVFPSTCRRDFLLGYSSTFTFRLVCLRVGSSRRDALRPSIVGPPGAEGWTSICARDPQLPRTGPSTQSPVCARHSLSSCAYGALLLIPSRRTLCERVFAHISGAFRAICTEFRAIPPLPSRPLSPDVKKKGPAMTSDV